MKTNYTLSYVARYDSLRTRLYHFLMREGRRVDEAMQAYRRRNVLSLEIVDDALEWVAKASDFQREALQLLHVNDDTVSATCTERRRRSLQVFQRDATQLLSKAKYLVLQWDEKLRPPCPLPPPELRARLAVYHTGRRRANSSAARSMPRADSALPYRPRCPSQSKSPTKRRSPFVVERDRLSRRRAAALLLVPADANVSSSPLLTPHTETCVDASGNRSVRVTSARTPAERREEKHLVHEAKTQLQHLLWEPCGAQRNALHYTTPGRYGAAARTPSTTRGRASAVAPPELPSPRNVWKSPRRTEETKAGGGGGGEARRVASPRARETVPTPTAPCAAGSACKDERSVRYSSPLRCTEGIDGATTPLKQRRVDREEKRPASVPDCLIIRSRSRGRF